LSDSDWEYREGSNNLIRPPNTDVSPSSVNLDIRLSLNTDVSPSSVNLDLRLSPNTDVSPSSVNLDLRLSITILTN
jgi:hypothetical protein